MYKLLLIIFALFFSLAAQAENRPCSLVSVLATHTIDANQFKELGMGWVIEHENSLYVLTPSHLVAGADQIDAFCESSKTRLKLQGISASFDLALFKITEPSLLLKPFLQSSQMQYSHSADGEKAYMIGVSPAQEAYPHHYLAGVATHVSGSDSPLLGNDYAIRLDMPDIRTGMSGSAVVSKSGEPMGMVVRSSLYDQHAYALPRHLIALALPYLLEGKDAWRAMESSRPYIKFEISQPDDDSLERKRMLYFPSIPGFSIKERCAKTINNDSWSAIQTGGDWGDGSVTIGKNIQQIGKKGGDWGDGIIAKDKNDRRQRRFTGRVIDLKGNLYAKFEDEKFCGQFGFETAQGVAILGIRDNNQVTPLLSINQLQGMYNEQGDSLPNYLEKHGIREDQELCREQVKYGTTGIVQVAAQTKWSAERYYAAEVKLKPKAESGYEPALACAGPMAPLHLRDNALSGMVKYDLSLSKEKVQGYISVGSCRVRANQSQMNRGAVEISNSKLTAFVYVLPGGAYFKLSILDVDPSCQSSAAAIPFAIQLKYQ